MTKKSILGTSLLLATLGLATPSYSQHSQEVQTQQQTHRYTLEQITSKNPPEDLTRDDYLEDLKSYIGNEKYLSMMSDYNKKKVWERYWKNASIEFLASTVKQYNPKLTLINREMEEIINEEFERTTPEFENLKPAYTAIILKELLIWMDPYNLTPREKLILNSYNRDFKSFVNYISPKKKSE